MNRMHVGLGSLVVATGSCILLLAGSPMRAHAKSLEPARTTMFVFRPEGPPVGFQEPKKVFPKVDPKDEIPLPDGEGKDTTKRLCGNCHSTNVWIKQRHSADKWSSIIDNMISKGMEASDDDIATVNDYLGKYLAPQPKDSAPPPPPEQ